MASSDMSFWISFFKEAGIPAGDAANYAVTFTDNRITRTMLLDLTKEYLNDMGISILGDVIAILKHSKTVYNKDVRERVLRDTTAVQETPVLPVPKRSTPASRTIDHYLRIAERSAERSASPSSQGSMKISKELSARLGNPSPSSVAPAVHQSPSVLSLRSATPVSKHEVPVQKKRRVFPEDEGHYTINMPQGSTTRTKKILSEQRQQAELQRIRAEEEKKRLTNKKVNTSVFSRLGSEKPKSAPAAGTAAQPTVTVTGLGNINIPSTSGTQPSIFARLGGKTTVKRAATSTVIFDDDDDDEVRGPQALEYAGVLKASPATPEKKAKLSAPKRLKITTKTAKKAAPAVPVKPKEPETAGVLASRSSSAMDIKSRLGLKGAEVSSTTQPVTATAKSQKHGTSSTLASKKQKLDKITITVETKAKSTTKSTPAASTASTTSGVFSRLGKAKS